MAEIPRYRVTTHCIADGCRCDHVHGVVLYDGPDRSEADEWAARSPYGVGGDYSTPVVETVEE